MIKVKIIVLSLTLSQIFCCNNSPAEQQPAVEQETHAAPTPLLVGAEQPERYLPLLEGKTVGMLVNQTSTVNGGHLVDSLIARGIDVKAIFAPEHGFRGEASAGEKITDGVDPKTGTPVISLYGKKRKPSVDDLSELEVVIFDIQDVGARFYTYISTLHYLMEACAENDVPLLIFDRPNPNGHYIDGPVLNPKYRSFVGMHPVPVVHGMTIGEYAQMINGEGWLGKGLICDLTIITCQGYDHNTFYDLPVKPSPNLPDMRAIYLYPSLCFFEGTIASEGRGTNKQFQVYGHPDYPAGDYQFTPVSRPGAKYPKLENQLCHGHDLSGVALKELQNWRRIRLNYLLDFYRSFPDRENFFIKTLFIDKLAGSDALRKAIVAGANEAEIRQSWQPGLNAFRAVREKYLLYRDF